MGGFGKKRKEKTTPFDANLMRSPVLYRAAQARVALHLILDTGAQKHVSETPLSALENSACTGDV